MYFILLLWIGGEKIMNEISILMLGGNLYLNFGIFKVILKYVIGVLKLWGLVVENVSKFYFIFVFFKGSGVDYVNVVVMVRVN